MHLKKVILGIIAVASVALCQSTLDSPYKVRYAANLNSGTDSIINIINTGGNGGVPVNGPGFGANSGGNMCVNIYALDALEELLTCCSCLVTPNQVVNLSALQLIRNTITGSMPTNATIKIIGSTDGTTAGALAATSCANESAQVQNTNAAGTHFAVGGWVAFGTTVHSTTTGQFTVTESPFIPAVLSNSEMISLSTRCAATLGNGSGAGVCSGCAKGALGSTKK